jgi:hypothetical protein
MPTHVVRFLIWIGVLVLVATAAAWYLMHSPGRGKIQSDHHGATVMLRMPDADWNLRAGLSS